MLVMWIKNTNEATARLYEAWMEEHVEDPVAELPGDAQGVVFNGPVQIRSEVGEQLVEQYGSVEVHDTENS